MSCKKKLSDEELIQDLFNRYDFEQDDDHSRQSKDGAWIRKCILLTNKKDPYRRRYVLWTLISGSDEWEVILTSPSPPKEQEGVKRKERIYVAAALRFIQGQLLKNRCKAPDGIASHGQCQRCGGDLICEIRHEMGTGYASRLVCFGRQGGNCEYTEEAR